MARKSEVVKTTVRIKETVVPRNAPKGEEDASFLFGWEGTVLDPLIYVARNIVDQVWPDVETPGVLNGDMDDTPIMRAVLMALRHELEAKVSDDA